MATTDTPADLQQVKMPSVSDKQKRFMAAAAHNPKFAAKAGISQSVAEEFNDADEAKAKKGGKKPIWHNKLGD